MKGIIEPLSFNLVWLVVGNEVTLFLKNGQFYTPRHQASTACPVLPGPLSQVSQGIWFTFLGDAGAPELLNCLAPHSVIAFPGRGLTP